MSADQERITATLIVDGAIVVTAKVSARRKTCGRAHAIGVGIDHSGGQIDALVIAVGIGGFPGIHSGRMFVGIARKPHIQLDLGRVIGFPIGDVAQSPVISRAAIWKIAIELLDIAVAIVLHAR